MEENQDNIRQLKVVIVEDNEALAEIYKVRLELIGYQVFVAHDGEEALEVIHREMPDLVLLDLMVPKIAGDEILRRMRESDWGKNIRVFIISNLNEVDAPRGLRELGIEGYVVKANLSEDQLDQLVDKILKPKSQTESTSLEVPGTIVKEEANPNPEGEQPPVEYQVHHEDNPSDEPGQHQPEQPDTPPPAPEVQPPENRPE